MKSDVYFVQANSNEIKQRCLALTKLIDKTQPFLKYKKDEFIPIKLTVGDSTCIYNISPELVKLLVAEIKQKKAKPFIFDTNVIYKGQRMNAVDHLNLVQSKGFGYSKIQAPFLIGDGIFGQDGREFKINSALVNTIKAPSFVGMLDSLLVLSHATGHILSGFAGAIKNVAMGMVCRPTKQVQHSSLKPHVLENKCTACGLCIEICPVQAISYRDKVAFIEQEICIGCGECLCACKFDAIYINWEEDVHIFAKRMAEVVGFILSYFKNKFFINFAFDITKECDCVSSKNEQIISQNLGILASHDIVSLDKATLDLVIQQARHPYLDKANTIYKTLLEYACQKGIGNLEYNLIRL